MRWFFIFFTFWVVPCGIAQEEVTKLPQEIKETSGLICIDGEKFLTINDSGGEPIIYVFTHEGKIVHRCTLTNAQNIDWEALTTDYKDRIFIGDFGNNKNQRKNLGVYTVSLQKILTSETIEASYFSFSYPDQTNFPPNKKELYFDAEGFVYYQDSLFIFTKNRTVPFDGKVNVYGLSTSDSVQVAKSYPEIQLETTSWLEDSVTDAALVNGHLILLTYSKLYVFNWTPQQHQLIDKITFDRITQKEGVCYFNGTVYLTDEQSVLGKPKLYTLNYELNSTSNN